MTRPISGAAPKQFLPDVKRKLCSKFGEDRSRTELTMLTVIEPNSASVRQSRDSLHRDRHKRTKKVAAAPCSETA